MSYLNKFELSDILKEISLHERGFKHDAFLNASVKIASMTDEEFMNYVKNDSFGSIYGFGSSICNVIYDYLKTGQSERLSSLIKTKVKLPL